MSICRKKTVQASLFVVSASMVSMRATYRSALSIRAVAAATLFLSKSTSPTAPALGGSLPSGFSIARRPTAPFMYICGMKLDVFTFTPIISTAFS